jgi:CS domain
VAWTQDESSLCIGVEVSDGVKGKDVKLEVHPKRMRLDILGKPVLEGGFPADVVPDGCFFSMETANNSRLCVITIEKKDVPSERWVELFEEEALDASITDKVRFRDA